jgi:hypothetical protein
MLLLNFVFAQFIAHLSLDLATPQSNCIFDLTAHLAHYLGVSLNRDSIEQLTCFYFSEKMGRKFADKSSKEKSRPDTEDERQKRKQERLQIAAQQIENVNFAYHYVERREQLGMNFIILLNVWLLNAYS